MLQHLKKSQKIYECYAENCTKMYKKKWQPLFNEFVADNEAKQRSAFLKSHSADQKKKKNTLKDVFLADQPYKTRNTWGSPSEHFIHSFQLIPDLENTSIFLLFKNRASAANKQMESFYNYWLQVL